MIIIKVTNPCYNKTYTINSELARFKKMFQNHIHALGYVAFEDVNGTLITISPDYFASVEVYEQEETTC